MSKCWNTIRSNPAILVDLHAWKLRLNKQVKSVHSKMTSPDGTSVSWGKSPVSLLKGLQTEISVTAGWLVL